MTSDARHKVHATLKKNTIINSVQRIIPIPLSLITAVLMSDIFTFATEGSLHKTIISSVILLSIVVGQNGLITFVDWIKNKKSSLDMHKCKIILYHDFLSYPLNALFATTHGDNIERMNDDFSTFTNKYTSLLPDVIVALITCISYGVYILFHSVEVGLLLFAVSILQIIPPFVVKKYLQINYDKCRDIEAELTNEIVEGYNGIKTIKIFSLKKWWINKIAKLHSNYYKIGSSSIYTASAENAINTLIGHILKFGTYAMVGMFALGNYLSLPLAIQIIALSGGLYSSVNSLFGIIPRYSISKLASKRLMAWPAEECANVNSAVFNQAEEDSIILKNLGFAYNDNGNVLTDCTYSFNAEKKYKIIGTNGAGKTTLINIISNLLLCNNGSLVFNSSNIDLQTHGQLPISYLYLLPQHDYQFDVTAKELFEMILFSKRETARAFCFQFGLTENQISNTTINKLSGGERKKVFLSLAFAIDPVFLILDEPTNSLDENGRSQLIKILKSRIHTTLIVSHTDELDDVIDETIIVSEGKIKNG